MALKKASCIQHIGFDYWCCIIRMKDLYNSEKDP